MSDQDDSRSLAQDFLEAYEANPREEIARALAEQREGIAEALDQYADELLKKRDRMIGVDRPRRASALEEAAGAARHSAMLAREFRLEVES